MNIFQRRRREELDRLVESYQKQPLPRREFLQHVMAAGFTLSAASSLLVACGGPSPESSPNGSTAKQTPTSINVLSVWGGAELETWKAICAPFTQQTKITFNNESTRDLDAVLATRVRGNNPPDVVGMPNIPQMRQYASQGKLLQLDTFLDMGRINQQYTKDWLSLGSHEGKLYTVWLKGTNKGTVWYNPEQFAAIGVQPPKTWDDMIALSNKIAASGKYPWSMGVESGASSGWPGTDWISQIYLSQNGSDMYNQWINHEIPWTHATVKSAFQMYGQIVGGDHYINDAPQSILATNFQTASYAPFTDPPEAYMYYLGDFTAGFITGQFKEIKPKTEFDFFPFPTINPQYQGAITCTGDLIVAMRDNEAVRQFMRYLTTPEAQSIWVKRGGATSINKAVDLSIYPNDVARASANMLTNSPIVQFGAGDLMPSVLQHAYWRGVLTFIGDQKELDNILNTLESTAQQAYTQ